MRKFKHKSSGLIAEQLTVNYKVGECEVPHVIIENSNDWEEVVEKGYEILSFITTSPPINIVLKRLNNHNTFGMYHAGEKELLASSIHKIHSVKRLSDGEVFTVGDFIDFGSFGNKGNQPIERFEVDYFDNNRISAYNSCYGIGFQKWNKILIPVNAPLFVTDDGVTIHKGEKFYVIDTKYSTWKLQETIGGHFTKELSTRKRFWHKDKADEFVLMNKPCLSITDIYQLCGSRNISDKELKELVKNKTK